MKTKSIVLTILVLGSWCKFVATANETSSLKLVHLIFRHGQRTSATFYPNDPHINVTYYPYGRGALTKFGRQQMFQLGKKIRNKYNFFLDDLYTPDVLEATCSYFSRTKTSLQLFLYALYPLPIEYRFDPKMDLQPIPYNEITKEKDNIFTTSDYCPEFFNALEKYIKSPDYLEKELDDRPLLEYIEKNSGLKMQSYRDIFKIHGTLKCEKEWGLALPTWTFDIFPKKLEMLLFKGYKLMTANEKLTKITAGGLIKKIIDDTLSKINKNSSFERKKLVVYSGHDITIGGLLGALKMLSLELLPKYAAHMIIELHYVNKTYGFKFFYAAELDNNIVQLKMQDCEEFCSIQQFVKLTKVYTSESETCRAKYTNNHYSWMLFITCSFMAIFYTALFICLVKYKKALKCANKTTTSEELRNLNDINT